VRVVPDVSVTGNGNGSGLMDSLMGMLVWKQAQEMTGNSTVSDLELSSDPEETNELSLPEVTTSTTTAPTPPSGDRKPLTIKNGTDFVNLDDLLK
jgi:hypothetical protein